MSETYGWIAAIKWVRTNYGLGLRDAKEWVEKNLPTIRNKRVPEWLLRDAAAMDPPRVKVRFTEDCYYLWVNDLRRAVQISGAEYNSLINHGNVDKQSVANGWVVFVRS